MSRKSNFDNLDIARNGIKEISKSLTAGCSGYIVQRRALERLFSLTSENYDRESVLIRLTTLDSMYSANSRMVPFSLDDLADIIIELGTENDAAQKFNAMLDKSIEVDSIFNAKVGFTRKKKGGLSRPSLVSKYAYYQLLLNKQEFPLGFPIYDSLVCNVLPYFVGCTKTRLKSDISYFFENIKTFCNALNLTPEETHNMQVYDAIDAYLWRLGKVFSGNLSLLVNKEDYQTLINKVQNNADGESFFAETIKCYNKSFFAGIKNEKTMQLLYSQYELVTSKK